MMHKAACSAAVLLFLSVSCSHLPARTKRNDPRPPSTRTSIEQISDDLDHRRQVAASTFEDHEKDGFMVGFVEFDDQGWFHNQEQFKTVQREMEKALINGERVRPAIVVSFVHGWRHTAAVCDRDVVCFREVLRGLAVYEAERARACSERHPGAPSCVQRVIAGVMIGWRGGPLRSGTPIEKLNVLTFYSRKSAAHTIGQSGHISTVVGWLNRLDKRLKKANPKSRLVLAGHSFGGAILFSSVSGVLNHQIAEERFKPGRDLNDCGTFKPEGIGDLVVLLNPAFEALRYDSIDAGTRDLQNCREPRSVLMTLASTTDQYNRVAFTIGRSLSTLFDHFDVPLQRTETRRALGQYEPFLTHDLTANGNEEALFSEDSPRTQRPCACQYATDKEAMKKLALAVEGVAPSSGERAVDVYAQMASPTEKCDTPSCLRPRPDKQAHNPFKVVAVDPKIIDGHSDIYNPRLLDFLVRSVAAADAPQPAPAPR